MPLRRREFDSYGLSQRLALAIGSKSCSADPGRRWSIAQKRRTHLGSMLAPQLAKTGDSVLGRAPTDLLALSRLAAIEKPLD